MSAARQEALRRGWCPGALRPMATGDGLLVRLRLTSGILPAGQARAIAQAARDFGSGRLDLTARANLQLRGVGDASLPGLTDRLAELGLLDADPESESVRNVLASPLAGLADDAMFDIRPSVRALEARLSGEVALHALPGKFGFIIDDGGSPGLAGLDADIRFEAVAGGVFRVRLARGDRAAACTPQTLPDVASALAQAFLALRGTGPTPARRMADLVDRLGEEAVFRQARIAASAAAPTRAPLVGARPVAAWGVIAMGPEAALGVGAPFGRFEAASLERLAAIAETAGNGELRLTPFRAVLLPGLERERAERLRQDLSGDFIVDGDDPRLSVAACSGAPACGNASTATQDDALALATVARATVPGGLAVHVSGCAKGCAHPAAAGVTLVGRDGRYDLVQNGTAADEPLRTHLTLDEARAAIASLVPSGREVIT